MTKAFLKFNDPLLRKVSKRIPASKISDPATVKIIKKMFKVAYGQQKDPKIPIMVGLAAPQIGIAKRIILVDIKSDGKGRVGNLYAFINPEIIWQSKKQNKWYEGCYSIPEVCGIVSRPTSIKIKAVTETGALYQGKFSGYVARIILHEIDHLDGKFFVDLISNPDNLHYVKPKEFPLYRNKGAWRNWPKKYPLPLA